uniref:OmpA family protein n=1 Tax=Flavobacterium sp. TaxID=239 RepID=UPI004049CBCD
MKITLVFLAVLILFGSCSSSTSKSSTKLAPSEQNTGSKSPDKVPSASWRNPVMSPVGADIARIIRGYFLIGDYNKMLQFVITPTCYSKKQIEQIIRKSSWGYEIKFTNLQWLQDSSFIITYKVNKNNTTSSEQYIGRIENDTAKIILFPEKNNLFQFYGDENIEDLCFLKNALDNVFFVFDQSEILPRSKKSLLSILNYLRENDQIKAHFVGHASNEGSVNHNKVLSEERAKAICNFLVTNGIDKYRLSAEGKGDRFPIVSNDTETNRAKNRRVEIVLSRE